jgi:hypothetical protein
MSMKVPYHGAKDVHTCVREIIAATPNDSKLPMSVNIMIKVLVEDGMYDGLAKKLPSQIRRGAALCVEWKEAFECGKFVQKLGRSSEASEYQIVRKLQSIRMNTDPENFKRRREIHQRKREEREALGIIHGQQGDNSDSQHNSQVTSSLSSI